MDNSEHRDSGTQREGEFGFSRRAFLGMVGVGAAAVALAACQSGGTMPLMANLPDGNALDNGYALPNVPQRTTLPPPTGGQQTNAYGVILRASWARGGPDMKRVVAMGEKKLITFHHSGDPKPFLATSFADTALHFEYVREYHVSKNFQDIGYHFGIDRVGRVWQLRSLAYEGQHVRYHNPNNIGVVVLGNFDMQAMTEAQKSQVITFGKLLRKQYALPISRVYTHQELVSTECPGTDMQPYMKTIRSRGMI